MNSVIEIKFGSSKYFHCIDLRDEVLRKPLNMKISDQDVKGEDEQYHFAIFQNMVIIGCVIAKPIGAGKVKLRQMAVDSNYQEQGFGKELIAKTEELLKNMGIKEIELNARKEAVEFYLKSGFNVVGEEFLEINIPHYLMKKDLTV